ncbi:hypothetical protein DSM104299_01834 [Baekduia alba]|uniref:hypothetical protein n=1 Tax=Baekduia alba TaxID=2997333 RepID=UPI002340C764|nr:hypothetical protein [Baekduia alba]WCB93130.1 hypothetical protein DSM104299_01834 [Baekduia alba]
MTATLTLFRPSILDPVEEPEQLRAARIAAPRPLAPAVSGGPTLDELLVGVWEDLTAHRTVACLACGEAMTPRYSAGPAPVGGRCTSCETTIA